MEITDFWLALRNRWRVVVLSVLAALIVSVLVTWNMTPEYSASARLFVSTSPSDTADAYQGGLFASQRVSSYTILATTSDELESAVSRALEQSTGNGEITSEVSAQVVPDTVILEITATDEDARRAQRTAQAYALAMSDMIGELETRRGDQEPLVKATVVDSAGLPTTPISPRPLRNLALGIVLGCLIGAALAVARQLLDTSITGIDDVAELTEVPILGNIFDSTAARGIPRRVLGEANPWGESFRVLRTNMQYVGVDSDRKVIVVTSPLQGEGKSTTAISLAVTFAQTNVRTVLVECDLRRPSLAGRLGLDDSVGTTSVLIGRVALADALQQYASTDLMTLTSGPIPPNPSELLQSHSMENLLAELRSDFDVVVLDTPPLLPVTDASILAAQADGALVVVRHGHTTREQLRLSIDRLETVGSKPLGIVLNMTPAKSGVSQGYGYGYGASATNTDEPGHHRQTVGRRRREA